MTKLLIIATSLFLQIQMTTNTGTLEVSKNITEKFWVNGVCDMCQTRIQKAALSVKGVKMANWDIESKILTVIFNPEKCTLNDIKSKIAAVGHDNDTFKAPDDVYDQLHFCCKYERI